MSDSFDLLDQLGDQKKVEALKAKVEQKKSKNVVAKLDEIESEIEKDLNEEDSIDDSSVGSLY